MRVSAETNRTVRLGLAANATQFWLLVAVNAFVGQHLRILPARQDGAELAEVAGLVEDGTLTPVIGRTYPLAGVADGLRHVEQGHTRGKAVVTVK